MIIAIVTAAGIGSRMNSKIPKQFLAVNNKPIVIHTIEALHRNQNIDGIIVACLSGWERMLESYVRELSLHKVQWIVTGGQTGQESITRCLERLRSEISNDDLVMVHDGNRPFIEAHVINESIRLCKEHGSAVAAIPCTEAILEMKDPEATAPLSDRAIDRDLLVRTQTPHTFPFGVLDAAYQQIKKHGSSAVAPCTVMITLGKTVHLSTGSELNFKITTQDDLKLFSLLARDNNGNTEPSC